LHQLRSDRHPIISKTRDINKLQKKYEDYINSVDERRDIVGKLKIQSTKMWEGIGKWKLQQRASIRLLNEIIEGNYQDMSVEDDCLDASSNAPARHNQDDSDDSDENWTTITQPPSSDHKCRFVNHERKRQIRPHSPTCPIRYPKHLQTTNKPVTRKTYSMETPVVNEYSFPAKKLNELQNDMQNLIDRKQTIDETITTLRSQIRSLIRQNAHCDSEFKLNSAITEGVWLEKELVRLMTQIDDIRKPQGFTKVARAFMATTVIPDEPFQVTNSIIHQVSEDPYDHVLYYDNSELQEDHKKLQSATQQLQEELAKVKAELTKIYQNLSSEDKTPRTSLPAVSNSNQNVTASTNDVKDLLSTTNFVPQVKPIDLMDPSGISSDATLQAKLAKELIKLANSYKIPELTFDVQASKRRYNFSTWFSKIQTILSMFPQTATVIQGGTVTFYKNSNDFGNKALFLLLGAKIDTYFQRAIRHFAGQGDKALAFIQTQCANVSNEDKAHFHYAFSTLRIKENESATAFIQRFIFAKTESESAGNNYSEQDLVSFVLTGLNYSKNPKYDTALQLYRLEREHGKLTFSLEDIE
jgi:hypothetical protein